MNIPLARHIEWNAWKTLYSRYHAAYNIFQESFLFHNMPHIDLVSIRQ